MAVKELVASIIKFLTQQLEEIAPDSRESLEVAIQCLESAYNVQASDVPSNVNLVDIYKSATGGSKPNSAPEATPEAKAQAEALKNEGNALIKQEKYHEALAKYTQAIQLDGRNAIYYGNRAAVYSKLGNHQHAIQDSYTALSIDPTYSRAYGRMGVAYACLNRHKEARDAYKRALEMEPDNESYKSNIRLTEEKLAQEQNTSGNANAGAFGNIDLNALFSNPALVSMAQQMLGDPDVQNIMRNFMSGNADQSALLEAGQRLAQTANPEILETFRRQLGVNNQNNPDKPEQN